MTWLSYAGVVLAAVLALGTTVFGEEPKAPVPEPAQKLTEADNGKTVKVKVGDLVVVSLKGNPTTGFSWRTAKLDGKSVEQAGEPKYVNKPHRKGMVGVGGMFSLKFNAAKSGKTEVNLEYSRPWEKDTKPLKTFTVTVEVEEK